MKPSQNSLFNADTWVRPVAESGILGLVHVLEQSLITIAQFQEVTEMIPTHYGITEP
jgi:hypothetical protein